MFTLFPLIHRNISFSFGQSFIKHLKLSISSNQHIADWVAPLPRSQQSPPPPLKFFHTPPSPPSSSFPYVTESKGQSLPLIPILPLYYQYYNKGSHCNHGYTTILTH